MARLDLENWDAKLKAAYVLGFDAGMRSPKSKRVKEWVARMVRLAFDCLTGGFWNPLHAYEFDKGFKQAFPVEQDVR